MSFRRVMVSQLIPVQFTIIILPIEISDQIHFGTSHSSYNKFPNISILMTIYQYYILFILIIHHLKHRFCQFRTSKTM